jgi:4-carboxymuconolactone decarboxylase
MNAYIRMPWHLKGCQQSVHGRPPGRMAELPLLAETMYTMVFSLSVVNPYSCSWRLIIAMTDPYLPLAERGSALREHLLGPQWISDSLANDGIFGGDFQEVVTALVWGGIWSRPGLAVRDRCLVVVSVLAALDRPAQLRQHLEGALRNGVTETELEEALLQVGGYAGIPKAVAAIELAKQVIAELGERDARAETQAESGT